MRVLPLLLALALALLASPAHAGVASVVAPLRLALSAEELSAELLAVSTPSSPRYCRHLSASEVAALVAPPRERFEAVARWMRERLGARDVRLSGAGDVAVGTVEDEAVRWSTHPDGMDLFAEGSAVDDDARAAVEFVRVVVPGRDVPPARTRAERLAPFALGQPLSTPATPAAQRAAAGIPASLNGTVAGLRQMVWGPGTYGYLESDLAAFAAQYSVPVAPGQVTRVGAKGQPGGDNFGEASLDVDTIVGSGQGVATQVANTNTSQSTEEGPGFGAALLGFVLKLSNMSDAELPAVVSMSLGSLSYDSCRVLCQRVSSASSPPATFKECIHYVQYTTRQVCMLPSGAQQDRIDAEFQKLGLRGVTLLAASGDGGSHYSFQPFGGGNTTLDAALNALSCQLNSPTYPASSPYVLGVGGTTWTTGPSTPSAWGASGGGFSYRYARPAYQHDAVEAYLAAANGTASFPPPGSFNAGGRAYPDVAAASTGVPMVDDGSSFLAGGTSAAAPSFAGVVSLLNAERLRAGLPLLGFLNPRVYEVAAKYPGAAFIDTEGGTSACNSAGTCCATGFPGAKGFDPLTGFGAPRWSGLAKYLASAP